MQHRTEPLRWEDAAEEATVTGWVCKKCHRWYGYGESGERSARYCCHTDAPCGTPGCTERKGKPYVLCDKCRRHKDNEQWAALPRVEWDGVTPLCLWNGDEYFFDADSLGEYIVESGLSVREVRVVLCEPDPGRTFDMEEFLQDHLPGEDGHFPHDCTEINKIVNDWIDEHAPYCWWGRGKAISVESILAAVGEDEEDQKQ